MTCISAVGTGSEHLLVIQRSQDWVVLGRGFRHVAKETVKILDDLPGILELVASKSRLSKFFTNTALKDICRFYGRVIA